MRALSPDGNSPHAMVAVGSAPELESSRFKSPRFYGSAMKRFALAGKRFALARLATVLAGFFGLSLLVGAAQAQTPQKPFMRDDLAISGAAIEE